MRRFLHELDWFIEDYIIGPVVDWLRTWRCK